MIISNPENIEKLARRLAKYDRFDPDSLAIWAPGPCLQAEENSVIVAPREPMPIWRLYWHKASSIITMINAEFGKEITA